MACVRLYVSDLANYPNDLCVCVFGLNKHIKIELYLLRNYTVQLLV